jgi:glycogen phosphorylase
MLLTRGDLYMNLDLTLYCKVQDRLGQLYAEPGAGAQKAIWNGAGSGKFSSDRSIAEYPGEIWKVEPCPVV